MDVRRTSLQYFWVPTLDLGQVLSCDFSALFWKMLCAFPKNRVLSWPLFHKKVLLLLIDKAFFQKMLLPKVTFAFFLRKIFVGNYVIFGVVYVIFYRLSGVAPGALCSWKPSIMLLFMLRKGLLCSYLCRHKLKIFSEKTYFCQIWYLCS